MASRPRLLFRALAIAVGVVFAAYLVAILRYPSDRTPEGAYLRVVKAVNLGRPKEFFAYTETAAQHASYTIRDYRKKARDRILSAYPEPDRSKLAAEYEPDATAPDGSDLFALHAAARGWVALLRRDLSGIAQVESQGERATVVTAHGTRYAFRRRENGIWGLTLFTPALVSDAEKAARDFAQIDRAATDYEHQAR
jgi:hypothetical protein